MPPPLRRVIEAVAVFAIALAGVIALLLYFENRDASTTAATATGSGPGVPDSTATSALLRAGNVELRFARAADRNKLVVFAQRQAGTDTSALRRIGGAIVVTRDTKVAGVVARAYKRSLQASSPSDPRLQAFVEAWLGQRR